MLLVARGFAGALIYALPIPDAIKNGFTNAATSLRAGSGGRVIQTALPFSLAIWIGESVRLAAAAAALIAIGEDRMRRAGMIDASARAA